jgi:hypothetical protein
LDLAPLVFYLFHIAPEPIELFDYNSVALSERQFHCLIYFPVKIFAACFFLKITVYLKIIVPGVFLDGLNLPFHVLILG